MTPLATLTGERRHESCRFGTLSQAWHIAETGLETPTVAPICNWQPAGDVPPGLTRAWGGLIEYGRDCALCRCFEAVTAGACA